MSARIGNFSVPFLFTIAAASFGAQAAPLNFEHDIRPILRAHCTHCHGEDVKAEGGVDLRLRRFMDAPLEDGGHIVVAGKPDESVMVKLIRAGEMPKKGKKVSALELAAIERWIAEGAKTVRPEPSSLPPGRYITEDDRDYWAFRPVKRPKAPAVSDTGRVRTPIDAFVLARLHEKHLDLAPEASKRTLIRRVTLDLTGLLPTPDEIAAFVADESTDAYEKVVDRLLASPAYGERWARHWLDAAGYADSNGFAEADSPRPYAWRYRDYVIRSFNADKPWNEFIVEQLAGDELAGATQVQTQRALLDEKLREDVIATAFLRMAPDGTGDEVDDPKLARNQVIAEQIKVVSSALLGLSVGCAQCHDHRFDPITQADYYRLRAIFEPAFDWQHWRKPAQRVYSLYSPVEQAKAAQIDKQAKVIELEANKMARKFLDEIFEKEILKVPEAERQAYREARLASSTPERLKKRTPAQKALIEKYPSALCLYSLNLYDAAAQKKVTDKLAEAQKLRATRPPESFVMALTETTDWVPLTHLFYRGDHDQPRQIVEPGELSVLAGPEVTPFKPAAVASGSTGRRLAYARWLTSGRHPTVARVLVNRFWLNHFGRGIVNTPGDFGLMGERPSHPELLDWLASEFVAGGWKLKPLHKLIVTSSVYRQSSRNDASLAADPDNRLYARFKLQRLDAEALRDSMLAAAGTLNTTPFGPPLPVVRELGGRTVIGNGEVNINGDLQKVVPLGPEAFRRSIYVLARRKTPLTVLDAFDEPAMQPNCDARNCTTVAPQSLLLMNDTFMLDTSHALAKRLRDELPGDARGQINRAWRLLYGQEPTSTEMMSALVYVAEQTETMRARIKPASVVPAVPAGKTASLQKEAPPPPDPQLDALASLCQVLYSSNRFLYVE